MAIRSATTTGYDYDIPTSILVTLRDGRVSSFKQRSVEDVLELRADLSFESLLRNLDALFERRFELTGQGPTFVHIYATFGQTYPRSEWKKLPVHDLNWSGVKVRQLRSHQNAEKTLDVTFMVDQEPELPRNRRELGDTEEDVGIAEDLEKGVGESSDRQSIGKGRNLNLGHRPSCVIQ